MSTVLWLHHLVGDAVVPVEEDLWALYKFAPQLDALCAKLGVQPLSSFHDTTDAELNLAPDDVAEQEGAALDGWALLRDKGNWRPPAELRQTLQALETRLREQPQRFGLLANRYNDVLTELQTALHSIESHKESAAPVLLAVVM